MASTAKSDEKSAQHSLAARKLPRLIHILFIATEHIHAEVPVSHLRVLLVVGAEQGMSVTEYAKRSGLTLSGCSRAIVQLSSIRRAHEPGPDLINVGINPMNRRERVVKLTTKGQRLFDSIMRELEAIAS